MTTNHTLLHPRRISTPSNRWESRTHGRDKPPGTPTFVSSPATTCGPRRVLESVAAVSDDAYRRDVGLFFRSIHGTLNHLLVGEHLLWFRRLDFEGISPKLALNAESPTAWRWPSACGRALLAGAADRPLARRALCRPARLHHHARHACLAALCCHVGPCVQPWHAPPQPDHGSADRAGTALP